MTTGADVVSEARSWIGTPFVHQGRLKGIGVDCIGVVVGVAKALGLSGYDKTDYGRAPNPAEMRAELATHMQPIAFKDVRPGDVLWFRVEGEPRHVGIVTETEPMAMVHSYSRARVMACIEQDVDGFWRKRVAGAFRYRGLD